MTTHRYSITIKPRWADVDANRHLRNSAYTDWATQVRYEWLTAHGFDLKAFFELGVTLVILEEHTKYFKEILLGESVTIDLQLLGLTEDASRFRTRQTFQRDNTVCAIHEILGAWFDLNNRRITTPPREVVKLTDDLVRTGDYAEIVSTRK